MVVLACSDRTLALNHVNVDVDSSMLKASSSSSLHGEKQELHPGVTCDGCRESPIAGVRYSCTVRKRYDNVDDVGNGDVDDVGNGDGDDVVDDGDDDDDRIFSTLLTLSLLSLQGTISAVHASRWLCSHTR